MQGREKWSPTIIFANPTALVKHLKISFAITLQLDQIQQRGGHWRHGAGSWGWIRLETGQHCLNSHGSSSRSHWFQLLLSVIEEIQLILICSQVHGDVFRAAASPMLFSSLIGTGAQLAVVVLFVVIFAILGQSFILFCILVFSQCPDTNSF